MQQKIQKQDLITLLTILHDLFSKTFDKVYFYCYEYENKLIMQINNKDIRQVEDPVVKYFDNVVTVSFDVNILPIKTCKEFEQLIREIISQKRQS